MKPISSVYISPVMRFNPGDTSLERSPPRIPVVGPVRRAPRRHGGVSFADMLHARMA